MPIALSVVRVGIIRVVLERGVDSNTIELLTWLDARPRSYTEAIDAWHSHCPRLTIWEDALADRLIRIERGVVTVTDRGRTALAAQ